MRLLLVSTTQACGLRSFEYRKAVANGSRSRYPSGHCSAQGHASLEELLASCVVRQVMQRDGVDPSDVRKLIASVANAIAVSR